MGNNYLITPHFRLHEWVAEEKGYFKAEGLDYEFREAFKGQDLARAHATVNKVGAYQNIEAGRDSNVSCACHWTVNVAASKGHAKMYADAYSVSPSAVFVPPELYTHHYRNEFPARFIPLMDVRRWGPGERIVFEPYTKEVFEESFRWIREHHIFDERDMGAGRYEDACVSLAA